MLRLIPQKYFVIFFYKYISTINIIVKEIKILISLWNSR